MATVVSRKRKGGNRLIGNVQKPNANYKSRRSFTERNKFNYMALQTPTLTDYQTDTYKNLMLNRLDATHVILSPRQMGKSILIELMLMESSVNHEDQVSIVVQPTLAQARKMGEEMAKMLGGTPVFHSYNSSYMILKFKNGSQVLFKSNEQGPDALRGYTVTSSGYLIIDEGAYISDDLYFASTPLVNAHRACTVIFSTPKFKTGFFYRLFTEGKATDNIYTYDWSKYPNPFLTEEKREAIRKTMPVQLYRADYLGEFMDTTSETFGDFEKVMSNNPEYNGEYVAAVDWGADKKQDYTVFTVFNSKREMVYYERWNDLNETSSLDRIAALTRKWMPKSLTVETNSIGSVYTGFLKRSLAGVKVRIKEVNMTNQFKNEIYQDLIVSIQNGTVRLLDSPDLKMELSAIKTEKTPSGKITYNAPKPYHDDITDTVAYCLNALKKGDVHYNYL